MARADADILSEARERGDDVAVATVIAGPGSGGQLLVWSGGQTFGDLGWPRLHQRVALYAAQLFGEAVPPPTTKRFEVPGGEVEVSVEILRRGAQG